MRRAGRSKLVVREGKIVKQCNHRMLAIGTHESFLRKGWLCCDCGEFILNPNLVTSKTHKRLPVPANRKTGATRRRLRSLSYRAQLRLL